MTLLIQALPLLALVALLASGRTGPVLACAVALALTLPAAWLAEPGAGVMASFVADSAAQGLWLAVIPVGIIIGGLVFHAAVGAHQDTAQPDRPGDAADVLFTGAFLLGPFAETVTGFGVGCVFAVASFRRIGVAGAPAAAIGLLSQLLIPWGGLGPGTAVGAALAGVPAQELAARNAIILAAELPFVLLLFWRLSAIAGHPVPNSRRAEQLAWVGAVGGLLVVWHHLVPWEVCGLLATGPVLAAKLLRNAPPRGREGWQRAVAAAFPYTLLAAVLLGSRLWRDAPALRPFPDLPALPLNHAMAALWLVALALLLRRANPAGVALGALRRAQRPALALLMFVLLARFLSNAGVPQALATALAGALGQFAPFAAPLLAGIAGFFAGTNVGSNAAMMPLQAALGRVAGLGPTVLPAVQNGTLFLVLSPQISAIASGLAGDGATPARVWRLAWPLFALGLAVGLVAVAVG
ncbi:L-lactate permease [Limobrevibacterium gyesilva]|uniref:L-lactate permease n=1 Tax=Limobrevibacterium gyesilva TaxID=2991712 RepID=A0AA42CJS4_9PROT|nr:L-lactate permease [Limobrevibacterium gyesilva]MCW3477155.1 L-lactate permease [Limobrevibacterium gyesilva]